MEVLPWIIDNMKEQESPASRRSTTTITTTTTERTTTTTKINPVDVTTNQPSVSRKGLKVLSSFISSNLYNVCRFVDYWRI